ncbi:ATP-binding cassette domain-containing protein [Dokdonia sinensis]|uniref:ATP-binding cassette domain-containing protein n=1 Tax=Dokdonia sinensis TaxID=2479847 RepID=A0A3M0GL04_9FLAO|nr:ATP-binding cassette domain-containing protein [Dokdonia sinensis]RMB57976.1 ATP-binding cassette domain-containing protein [Dokdonia sinensis]
MNSVLKLYYARKSFGSKKVLTNVSFELAQGEIIGIFGRNGSGKSTLLKMLFGTLKADALDVRINNLPVKQSQIITEQHIGYLPQDNFLPKHLKVRDVIPLFFSAGEEQDLIFRAPFIERIAKTKIGLLSMGERRYLELLLVAHLPHPFLLLDEPFSMIEPLYKEEIKKFLISLKAKKGIVLTDHYYPDVLEVSDRNIVLVNGESTPAAGEKALMELGYLR